MKLIISILIILFILTGLFFLGCYNPKYKSYPIGYIDSDGNVDTTRSVYPNPFSPTTTITVNFLTEQHVLIEIYNVLGEKVGIVHDSLLYGYHEFELDTMYLVDFKIPFLPDTTYNSVSTLTAGVYFYRIITEDDTITKKMILLK